MSVFTTDTRVYSGDFTEPVAISPRRVVFPIMDRPDLGRAYEQDFMVRMDSYEPLALDTTSEELPDHYLTYETPLQHVGNGIGTFTRTYTQVFSSWKKYETYSYTVPGITAPDGVRIFSITSASNVGSVTRITYTPVGGSFEAGDAVVIAYWATSTMEGLIYNRQVSREILTKVSDSVVDVAIIVDAYPITSYTTIRHSDYSRTPRQVVVSSTLVMEYFLPGVSAGIDDPSDIPILQPLLIFDAVTGNLTDSYSVNSTPTLAEYKAMIANKELIVAEPSQLHQLTGNLWERATRYVTAM